ncbi:MAG: hypothetical protein WCT32_02160 [Patescibacteria group bacterium]|jgi:hypothetical protein
MEGEEERTLPTKETKPKGKKWLMLVIVIVLLVAAVGYFVFASKSSDGSGGGGILSTVVSKSLNPNCRYNDPDLCKFINGWKEVKYFTMNSSDTAADGKTTASVFKMEGKENSQIIMSENGKESYQTISIGTTTYTKDYSDNKWFKYTPKPTDTNVAAETESQVDFDTKVDDTADKTTYQKIGTEACAKLTCFKYKVVDPANTDYTEFIYFDNKDYQLRKTRTEMKDGSVSEGTYDYAKLSISTPSPVKEGSPYNVLINDAASSAASVVAPSTSISSDSSAANDTSTDNSSSIDYDDSVSTDASISNDSVIYDTGE